MAETCLASITPTPTTTLFTKTKTQHNPILSFASNPIKKSFSLSLKHNSSKLPSLHRLRIIPLVAETSDWAPQQEEGSEEDSFVVEPSSEEEAKLYVGNLPFDVDSEQLAELFNQVGVVEVAEVIYNRETDTSRGFGFVTMSSVEEAEKAVETLHRRDFNGRLLNVNKAAAKGSRPERSQSFGPSTKIYVGNLPWSIDEGRLEQVFSEHGKVVEAKVVYDRESGRSRGFGFVTMASETEVNDAIAALDGQSLDGRSIRVNVAEQRPRRTF
ncbi:hypothetical protein ACFE04_005208 [Oxalis oulophora]